MTRIERSVLALVACVSLASCGDGDKLSVSMDYPEYSTVQALNGKAQLVVVGRVGRVLASELDNGGSPETADEGGPAGTPLSFYDISVTETLHGEDPGESIVIAWLDRSRLADDDQISALNSGDEVILWLVERTPEQAPGVSSVKNFWVPVSGDNGVMDVRGVRAVARSTVLTGVDRAGSERLDTTVDAVRAESAR